MTKLDTIKGKVSEAEEFARKIWLAGLGAYGKSFDEAQGQYDKLTAEAGKVFEDLVEKGESLETEAKAKIKSKTNVEERVAEVRKKLGLDKASSEDKVEELSAKIDALTDAVAKLAAK
ncbi:phasin family protein [Aliiglaciecola litoralis]|uniref:Poly(Hydroxyalkanoate) granule-associated protein n=1 Tax=Aliiglaciecola litoralis TaxID=582857 RepID=A0ABN1LN63_9ALTE